MRRKGLDTGALRLHSALPGFLRHFPALFMLFRFFPPALGPTRSRLALSALIRFFPPFLGPFRLLLGPFRFPSVLSAFSSALSTPPLSAAGAMAGGCGSPSAPCCPGRAAMPSPCCQSRLAVPSVHQSLSEMDFERGIWAAARDGDEARVLQLLERRGDPAEPDLAGYTALHYASRNGHLGVCRLLLERGAPCDARTPGGATPLHRACYCGHRAVTELLLAHGADPAATDGDGRTGLHKAAEQGHRELCALLLRQRPALAALRDARGRSPRDGAHPAVWDLLDT